MLNVYNWTDYIDPYAVARFERETGIKPWWAIETFTDPYVDVRQSMSRLHSSPFIVEKEHIRGFVYDVRSGRLHEVRVTAGVR